MSNFCIQYNKTAITSRNKKLLTIAIFNDEVKNNIIFYK